MLPLPPRSTLFPYTTLFRSFRERTPGIVDEVFGRVRVVVDFLRIEVEYVHARVRERPRDVTIQTDSDARQPGNREDRKSTRLNSSHMSISYAVFCLKKKKIK